MARSRRTPGARSKPRIGVVLGAGGVLGAAWMAGALGALEERLDRPIRDVDLVVGTSAGSVLAAALRCGVSVEEIVDHQRGSTLVALPHLGEIDRDSGGALPGLPRLRLGSPRLLVSSARAPHRVHPWVAASALVPQGRSQHRSLNALVLALVAQAAASAQAGVGTASAGPDAARPHPDWTPHGETWVMAVDYESGRRVAFGRVGAPHAPLPDAVVASCSIPGWYEPKTIQGRRYVDGGVRSSTSLDLLGRLELDEVFVLAPMASFATDTPRSAPARVERLVRRVITLGLMREARKVEATGARVTVLAPGTEDLAAIGVNLMDPARRQLVLETSLHTSPRALREVYRTRAA